MRRFGELNVGVADDLDAIAPRVEKVEKRAGQGLDAGIRQRPADDLFVVDDEAEVTAVVGRLFAAFLQRDELVAKIDEGIRIALAPQLEGEEATVECQGGFDVADLQGDMIEAHGTSLSRFSHRILRF